MVTDGLISYLGTNRSTSHTKGMRPALASPFRYKHMTIGHLHRTSRDITAAPATPKLQIPAHSLQPTALRTGFHCVPGN